jgi:iron complex outermembrane receptor protein
MTAEGIASQNIHQILYETQETTSTAVFAQMDYDLTDALTLTAGLRWTKEEKHFIAGQSYLTTADRETLRQFPEYADLEQDWTEVSPKIGLTYTINDSSMVLTKTFGTLKETSMILNMPAISKLAIRASI